MSANPRLAAVCDELGALGPTSRHHAEAAAAAQLRAVRAQRPEDDLLARLAGDDGGAAAALLADHRDELEAEALSGLVVELDLEEQQIRVALGER